MHLLHVKPALAQQRMNDINLGDNNMERYKLILEILCRKRLQYFTIAVE